jgi:hypothetical protein
LNFIYRACNENKKDQIGEMGKPGRKEGPEGQQIKEKQQTNGSKKFSFWKHL